MCRKRFAKTFCCLMLRWLSGRCKNSGRKLTAKWTIVGNFSRDRIHHSTNRNCRSSHPTSHSLFTRPKQFSKICMVDLGNFSGDLGTCQPHRKGASLLRLRDYQPSMLLETKLMVKWLLDEVATNRSSIVQTQLRRASHGATRCACSTVPHFGCAYLKSS